MPFHISERDGTIYISNNEGQYTISEQPLAVGSCLYQGHSYKTRNILSFTFKKIIVRKPIKPPQQKQRPHNHVLRFIDWIDIDDAEHSQQIERYLIYPAAGLCRTDLSHYIADNPQLRIFPLIRHLLEGLTYCHAHGITHGRIEPSTLLIDTVDHPTLILTFDPSKEFKIESSPLHQIIVGPYSPPEVWLNSKKPDCSVDCWAAGCVIGYLYRGGQDLFPSAGGIESILSTIGTPLSGPPPHYERRDLVSFLMQPPPSVVTEIYDKFLVLDPASRLRAREAYSMICESQVSNSEHPPYRSAAHFPVVDKEVLERLSKSSSFRATNM